MKTFIFVITMLTLSSIQINSQVLTRILTPDQKMEEIITFPIDEDIHYYLQPKVDFDQVLEQDRLEGNPLYRFAVKVDQDYKVNDGHWRQVGNWIIWQIGFSAPTASSLNFLISELNLPLGAEMFIASKDGRIIHGPITSEVIYEHTYASDIIESQDVQIVFKCKKDNYQQFSIKIYGVCQGIPKSLEIREFGDAADCNIDVNCPQGSGWENERDAVALALENGQFTCSGSLVNNQCKDIRPYFLSAFHCLDFDKNGQLSSSEKNLSNFNYRFKFEAGTPQCPGNSTGTQGTWIVYSGAAFRAGNFASDFALVELNGSIANQSRIALAGWDRRNIVPQSTAIIHHPAGDAKKITFDYGVAQQITVSGRLCWWLNIDDGATEDGSSGAPYLNQDKRIVGQHFDTGNKDLTICEREAKFGGRFDISWTGAGTNDTRLSNWLGTINPPYTMNTIRVPYINSNTANDFLICTTNKQIALSDPILGRSITWSVDHPGLFATTAGASTSGYGAIATLRAADNTSSGSAILTFTLSQPGCDDVNITQTLWVGLPDFGLNYIDNICLGSLEIASIDLYGPHGTSLGNIVWSFSGSITGVGSTAIARYRGVSTGWGNICVTATNACGETTKCFWVYVDECKIWGNNTEDAEKKSSQTRITTQFDVYPNPITDVLSLSIAPTESDLESLITIYDTNGKSIFQQKINEQNVQIDMRDQASGMYFVQIIKNHNFITKKIIKI